MKYVFSKGELDLDGNRLRGWVKASTDFQHEIPSRMDIDTTVDKIGPINISEVKQFRLILTMAVVFPALAILFAIIEVALCLFVGGPTLLYVLGGLGLAGWLSNMIGNKWLKVYMAKFSNNGQTVYVPFIKAKEHHVIMELESELKNLR